MASEITKSDTISDRSRLFYPMERTMTKVCFNLVDYRNNYFTSDDPNKIIEFYKGFENRDQLIQWMRERPKGVSNILEVDGDKDIIVVIPTADFNGKYAKECRDNIFKGLHIVFVESGGRGDFYFNYAHNCNVGIRKAMEYNPKWVVVSNDDMSMIDSPDILKSRLNQISYQDVDVVFTNPSLYHSVPLNFSSARITRRVYFKFRKYRRVQQKLENKYEIKLFSSPNRGVWKLFYKSNLKHLSIGSFIFLNYRILEQRDGKLFDETYINATEDVDLELELVKKKQRTAIIDFRIGDHFGGTLGNGPARKLRNVAGEAYLNWKIGEKNNSKSNR